ncbi:FAD-dependent oxidoreductase [Thermodesulfatator autotrophicus]|uniref:Heterodisulfide reductase n=1 Tax=Thermodesulfatator autotrophicus TaxID=1795632 RepID=A0A177E480_9BACT|nr:FAD-dependent oxidoreductase [Thermodesulfatator autotrophicus]OAG26764.1 heterodisulfide reductase [Thermodesulfatator autotrophicus]
MGKGSVLIIGGGIAGVQSALDLAAGGFLVYLLERKPAIGGVMSQLDKTFPTNDCSMCILSPKLVEVSRHPNIKLLTLSEPISLSGTPGDFTVRIRRYPRYIDEEKCMACGECTNKCPKKVPNEFDQGLSSRKAIYLMYPQAVPLKYAIDPENCIWLNKPGRCGFCAKVCPSGAINFEQKIEELELKVGAILVASGFETFDPSFLHTLGYRRLPQVITSLEFERLLSASGPTRGELRHPFDGKPFKKIAWLQCVGSRDISRAKVPYCSSVCCMYALKQAVIAKEHARGPLETAIFYMDMRTMGKGFEAYLERAKEEGVRLVRSRIHSVLPYGDKALLHYFDESCQFNDESFDLVVLSVGLKPHSSIASLSEIIKCPLDDFGFLKSRLQENKPGVFVCGVASGPKDIPETVTEASAAAARVQEILASARHTETKHKTYPPERFVFPEEPRIGVFVCHCGMNIAGVIDVKEVTAFAATLPDVVFASDNLFTCAEDTIKKIVATIKEKKLNRVVVAACTPRTHEPIFQESLREAGLNPYLFEMANIRDQASWVHPEEPKKATKKAKDLVLMAVNRVRLKRPVSISWHEVEKRALVIGGGLAGLTASLSLAAQGFPTVLVDKEKELGGFARIVKRHLEDSSLPELAQTLVKEVKDHPLIEIKKETRVEDVSGSVGQFQTKLSTRENIKHGVTIIATGAKPYFPQGPYAFGYGDSPQVKLNFELDTLMANQPEEIKNYREVVFIQCVGSRTPENPYCSRVCCTRTMEQILALKEINPGLKIFVLYRDIRTYGKKEILYLRAREKGAIFIRYDLNDLPQVQAKQGLSVKVFEPVLDKELILNPDILILATAIVPDKESQELAKFYKCALSQEGFMLEAHQKLRPVDFATEGVFMAGLCHYPKPAEESMAQGLAAAARAATILAKEKLPSSALVAESDPRKCSACGQCEKVCPYHAITLAELKPFGLVSQINPSICKGCGNCLSSCRSGAIKLKNLDEEIILASLEGAFGRLWY